jgi:DNA repair protein RadC
MAARPLRFSPGEDNHQEAHIMQRKKLDKGAFIRDASGKYATARPATEAELIAQAAAILETRQRGKALSSPADSREFLRLRLAPLEHEVFAALFLDTRHRVIEFEIMFTGTIDGASVHPREVVKAALRHNAAAIIFSHNHPSGVVDPSRSDESLTRRLKDALGLIDVRVLDHIIVGTEGTMSFAERGLL